MLNGTKRSQWSLAQEIEELRPTEAAVVIEWPRYTRKIKIKKVQVHLHSLGTEGGGCTKIILTKSGGLCPSEVGGARFGSRR